MLTMSKEETFKPGVSLSEEEEWDLQVKQLEEVDKWSKLAEENIPSELKSTLSSLIKTFPGLQRLPAFHLMFSYEWNYEKLSCLNDILHQIPNDKVLITIDFLLSLVPIIEELKLHYLGLKIFSKLRSEYIIEWTSVLSLEEGHFLIQIARHLPEVELDLMIYNIHELTITEMVAMIKRIITSSEAKKCELCRQKRLFSLEYRMRTNQLPSQHLPTPGIIPHLETHQMWSADDEKQFSFDTTVGQVYWNERYPVNLIEICDKCLLDVHQSITNKGRFDPIHHIDASIRKDVIEYHRRIEEELAIIVMQVAKERKYRRLREFSIKVVELQRSGLRKEEDSRQSIKRKLLQNSENERIKQEREQLNDKAMSNDYKWLMNDRDSTSESLEKRKTYTMLKYHLGFDESKNPPPQVRRKKTWRLEDFDSSGLPLTEAAANKVSCVTISC
jgi:hypothetical protein